MRTHARYDVMLHLHAMKSTRLLLVIAGLASLPLAACNGSSAPTGAGSPDAAPGSGAAGNAANQGGMDNNVSGYNQGSPN